jgi:beta-fructofuranosidase
MTSIRAGAADKRSGPGRPRPLLHFAPQRGWMNDPNGLIQWNGRTHMFYQHNPSGPVPENIAWGHASTTDLWTWDDHPLALEPDPAGPDRDGCFSGCAVVPDGRPHLLYTGVNGRRQLPCLAVASGQDLIRWTRYERNPVIVSPPPGEVVTAFRDHSAWWAGSMWYQAVGGGLRDRGGALFLYRSADLRNWEYLGIFAAAADHGLDGVIWECPDVFALGEVVVVVVSVWDGQAAYPMWMTGQVAGDTFIPHVTGRCDSGQRYYAPQSLTLADGRRVAFGWLRESAGELAGADRSRVGVMSLPRELRLDASGSLRARPARELDTARHEILLAHAIEGRGTAGLALSARARHATEIDLTMVRGEAAVVRLRLAGRGCADVQILVAADGVEITEGGRPLTTASPAPPSADSPVGQVSAYYDGGILEVYSPRAAPAAVICHRRGSYQCVEVEVSGRPGEPPGTAGLTAWSCGRLRGSCLAVAADLAGRLSGRHGQRHDHGQPAAGSLLRFDGGPHRLG